MALPVNGLKKEAWQTPIQKQAEDHVAALPNFLTEGEQS